MPRPQQFQKPSSNFLAKRNGKKKVRLIGIAMNILFAYSTDCAESLHSICENASAIKVVRGKAVKKPAKPVFFPDNQETKLIIIADAKILRTKVIY